MNACPGCHMLLEPANRLVLPDGRVVHRDKGRCVALGSMNPSQATEYHRLTTRASLDLLEAYRRATGRNWAWPIPPVSAPPQVVSGFAG